jgi:rhamnosyl/mannosyltransferase
MSAAPPLRPPGRRIPPAADLLQLGKYYPPEPGGIEQVTCALVESTRGRLSHYCLLATRSGRTRIEEIPGARLHFLRERGTVLLAPVLPGLPLVLHRLRRGGGFPVVLLHAPNPLVTVALALSFAARPKREKLLVWHHADALFDRAWQRTVHAFYRLFERFVYRRADCFVAATPHHVTASPVLRAVGSRTRVIPYAVPDDWFAAQAEDAARADACRREMGGRYLLFVGRLAAYKGLDTLLEAAPALDAPVAIVGRGPLAPVLEREIAARGLRARVRLLGHVEDLRGWYAGCEALVLPSSSALEAFGLVQVEAMAMTRPVVSSNLLTGVTWVNRDGETGLTFPVGDPAALAAACNRLLGDEDLRTRLGERAKARAAREFSYAALGDRLVGLIAELGGSSRA